MDFKTIEFFKVIKDHCAKREGCKGCEFWEKTACILDDVQPENWNLRKICTAINNILKLVDNVNFTN